MRTSLRHLQLGLVLAVCLAPMGGSAARAIAMQETDAMNSFVIIFRQGPPTLTETDRQRRAAETIEWAVHYSGAGHKPNPHILGPERAYRDPDGALAPDDGWPVTALLFLEARDLDEAAQIAGEHPAVRYGASVEIRPWTSPVPGQ